MKTGSMSLRYILLYLVVIGYADHAWGQSQALLTFDQVLKNGGNTVDGLSGASEVLISPDSLYIYVVSTLGSEVGLFRREKASGTLTFIEAVTDNLGGVDGIGGAAGGAISPDGKHLYVAAGSDDAIAVFSRNSSTGQLTFVAFKKDDLAGVDGLNGATGVAVSGDGNQVYVTGVFDDALVVFNRNSTTGELTFVEAFKDGQSGVDGLDGVNSITISPDDKQVYVTGGNDNALAVFSRNVTTGQLTFLEVHKDGLGGVNGLGGASDVAISPDGNHAYATGSFDEMAVFSRNPATGALTFIEAHVDNVGGVDGLDGASAVTVSPDNNHVYVTGNVDNAVAVFNRNTGTGTLSFVEAEFDGQGDVDGLDGARHVLVSPEGTHVYIAGGDDSGIAIFGRNGTTGALSFIDAEINGTGGINGLSVVQDVIVSPDNQNVYVVDGFGSTLAVFQRDSVTDRLRFIEIHRDNQGGVDGLSGGHDLAISADGKFIYVASEFDDGVAVFSRGVAGALTFVEAKFDGIGGANGLDGAISVTLSPDDKHVYVASNRDDALAVFSRDTTTGKLTSLEFHQQGTNGVDGINNATAVEVSSDGKNVYVTGSIENSLAVFNRDTVTGLLTFVERYRNGVDSVDGLLFALDLVISPDGKYVYAAGTSDHKIALFSRDSSTGKLTFIEVVADNQGGVDGLRLVSALAISPDGQYLFATGDGDDALAVFTRNTETGRLSLLEVHEDDQGAVDGLDGPNGVAVSPDNRFVYAVGDLSDGLAVFRVNDVPPQTPLSFSGLAGENRVTFKWLPNADLDMSHYNIYRHTTSDSTLAAVVLAVNHPDTTGTDTTALNNTLYFYWISAVDSANNESILSARITARPSDAPPTNPLVLVANSGHRKVTLFWNPVQATDLSHYTIYRQTVSSFTPTRGDSIFSVLQPDTSHVDTTVVNGNTYYYRITAVDTLGNESTPSSEAIGFPTGPTDVTLSSFTTNEEFGAVIFVWQVSRAKNHAGFHLLRGLTPKGPFNKINTTLIRPEEKNQYRFKDMTVEANRTYTYQLQAVDVNGEVGVVHSVTLTVKPPATFELGQNFPNPFNPETTIRYALAEPSHVRIVIYNLVGQVVHILVDADQPVGFHTAYWNGRNARGQQISSGIYLYQIEAGTFVDTRKMLLIK